MAASPDDLPNFSVNSTMQASGSTQSGSGEAEALRRIEEARQTGAEVLDLGGLGLTEITDELIEKLASLGQLPTLHLGLAKGVAEKSYYARTNEDEKLCNAVRVLPPALFSVLIYLNTRRLYLDGNQLTALPAEIGGLAALTELYLDGNQLTALPAEIGGLAALTELSLNGNQLTALPAEIGGLVALTELGLDDNQLTALPAEIGGLASLTWLALDRNQLTALPAEIGGLVALKWLSLSGNQLTALPAEICRLAALMGLSLIDNQLTVLPAEIGRLAALTRLHLDVNQLTALPTEIGGLAALTALGLNGNQLPPQYVKAWEEGGIAALAALLMALHEDDAKPLFEAKLLVTGAGKVGKSWALAALRGEKPEDVVGEQTTYGVYCGELPLPHPDAGQNGSLPPGAEIHLNTWDFGGQNVYRITHQFFFTQEAVFLLVWNPRDGAEKCGVREWLRMIELRTGGAAKVIMVASHSPRDKTPYLPKYGRERLPDDLSAMIVDEIAIDSVTGDNIPELRAMIARHAATLRFMGDPFPVSWSNARQAVAALNPAGQPKQVPHITYDRFLDICRENGVSDEGQAFTLATVFMHNLGRAIYYGERHQGAGANSLLANIMVLDAEWLSRAFVQVIEDEQTNADGGMLDHARLDRIWRTHGRDDWQTFGWRDHPFLIRLMHAFDMSYVVKGRDGKRSLVPQLLPVAEPELPWRNPPGHNGVQPVRLICKMENEVHGLMARFIVQTAPYHSACKTFWRDGVFLREPTYGTEALVTLEGVEKPVMTITVSGTQPSWFLGELHRTLLELLEFWPGLDKTFYIGCPTRLNDGSFCKGEFKFKYFVEQDKKKPNREHACQDCDEDYTPRQLLSGFRGVEEQQETPLEAQLALYLARQQDAPCPRAFTLAPVKWAWYDPNRYVPGNLTGKKLRLTLHSEHSLKPITSKEFEISPRWVGRLGPVARVASVALTLATLGFAGDFAKEIERTAKFMKELDGLGKADDAILGRMRTGGKGEERARISWPSGAELEELHELLKEIGLAPQFGGMKFVKIRHKGYLWVSKEEAEAFAEEIPRLSYIPDGA